MIGTVEFARWETSWTLNFKQKKKLFGDYHVAVGGPGDAEPADDVSEIQVTDCDNLDDQPVEDTLPGKDQFVLRPGRLSRAIVREDTNIEPVFLHALDIKVYEEFLHSFVVQAMVDGTPGPGHCALACVRRRVPYLGLCLSDDHATLLMKRIVYLVFQEMKKEDSPLFELALIKILKDSADDNQGESNPEPKKQRKRQGRQSDTEGGPPRSPAQESCQTPDAKPPQTRARKAPALTTNTAMPERTMPERTSLGGSRKHTLFPR